MNRKGLWAIALAVSMAAGMPVAMGQEPATTTAATSETNVHVVAKGSIPMELKLTGRFEPVDPLEVKLRMKAFGGELRVAQAAAHGSAVKQGDVILKLDPADAERALADAENKLASARAALAKAEADASMGSQSAALAMEAAERDLEYARAAVDWFEKVEAPQILRSAELSVRNVQNSVEDQEDELNELRKMYKSEELTSATADIVVKRAVRQLELTRINLEMTRERSRKTVEFELPKSREHVQRAMKNAMQAMAELKVNQAHAAEVRRTAVASARLALANAEKYANDLREDIAALTVTAPMDGVVLWKDVKALRAGETIQARQQVLTFYVPGAMTVVAPVEESKALWAEAGVKATVIPTALPQLHYNGRVLPLARPAAGGSGVEVKVEIHGVDTRISPGMSASVRVDAGTIDDVLVVPVKAVKDGMVQVQLADGKVESRSVVTGRSDGKVIEIVEGLAEGDRVVPGGGQ